MSRTLNLCLTGLLILAFLGLSYIVPSTQAKAQTTLLLANDNGQLSGQTVGLEGERTVAARLSLPAERWPIRLDALQVFLIPQDGLATARLLIRLEPSLHDAPAGDDPLYTWRVSIPISADGWTTIPLLHLLDQSADSIIISLKSEDFPWVKSPQVMLDTSTQIDSNRNFYGENFSQWLEHYTYWPDPADVGNLMIRVQVTTGEEALVTPTATLSPTPSPTQTFTPSPTASSTPTYTPTPIPTSTSTPTPTPTITLTMTPSSTPSGTPTPTPVKIETSLFLPLYRIP